MRREAPLAGAVSPDPFYVAQTEECKTREDRDAWLHTIMDDARAKGGAWSRVTLGCEGHPDLLLFESWKVRPENEGQPRFSLMLTVSE